MGFFLVVGWGNLPDPDNLQDCKFFPLRSENVDHDEEFNSDVAYDISLREILADNQRAGDEDARFVSRAELRELEPALGPGALGAVLCPHEAVVEPWLVPLGYAESARLNGAHLRAGTEVLGCELVKAKHKQQSRSWILKTRNRWDHGGMGRDDGAQEVHEVHNSPPPVRAPVEQVHARVVVNCAGLSGDVVERMRLQKQKTVEQDVGFSIQPRKGEFVVFARKKNVELENPRPTGTPVESPSYVIEGVPSQFTKGVIVWKSLYGNIIVWPTAEPQASRSDRSTNPATIEVLHKHGAKVFPSLLDESFTISKQSVGEESAGRQGDEQEPKQPTDKNGTKTAAWKVVGSYAGLRPATEHRDYQIRALPEQNWVTVAGVRSTGLSASAGIGEYVAELVEAVLDGSSSSQNASSSFVPPPHASDAIIGVTAAVERGPLPVEEQGCRNSSNRRRKSKIIHNASVPSLEELALDFCNAKDGTVEVYGRRHRVTHPISFLGLQSLGIDLAGESTS